MEMYFAIGFIGSLLALGFAQSRRAAVMSQSEGTDRMTEIAQAIRDGADAYLKAQYSTVAKIFAIVFVALLAMAFGTNGSMLSKFTPFAFLTGGIFSMLAGYIGMKISTNANARTANAAMESLNHGLRVAFSSGSVMGFTVVGLGMLDISIWFFLLRFVFGITDPLELGNIMVMNGMGASFMALFARVGGGIYTKAADVGADFVPKALKPRRYGYRRAMELMGTVPENTVSVGDQLFTDIWGANRIGMHSILTKPLVFLDEPQIMLKRLAEAPFLYLYNRKKRQSEKQ